MLPAFYPSPFPILDDKGGGEAHCLKENIPGFNMKCSGDNVILRGIFHVVHIMFSTKFHVLLRKFGLLFGQCRKLCISTNRGLGQVGLTPSGWSYVVLFTNCIIGYMIITRFELQISQLRALLPRERTPHPLLLHQLYTTPPPPWLGRGKGVGCSRQLTSSSSRPGARGG